MNGQPTLINILTRFQLHPVLSDRCAGRAAKSEARAEGRGCQEGGRLGQDEEVGRRKTRGWAEKLCPCVSATMLYCFVLNDKKALWYVKNLQPLEEEISCMMRTEPALIRCITLSAYFLLKSSCVCVPSPMQHLAAGIIEDYQFKNSYTKWVVSVPLILSYSFTTGTKDWEGSSNRIRIE